VIFSDTKKEIKEEVFNILLEEMGSLVIVDHFPLSPIQFNNIQSLVFVKKKIMAIKLLREITGWKLMRAKLAIEDTNYFRQKLKE